MKLGYIKHHDHPSWRAWTSMKQRCDYKNHPSYPRYGGRGITYCADWKFFDRFVRDMGEKQRFWCLHRINNDGNYTKENCVWLPVKEHRKLHN